MRLKYPPLFMFLIFFLSANSVFCAGSLHPFDQGKKAFDKGSCRQAINYLRAFLANHKLLQSSKDITDSYKMLAICFVQEREIDEATREIESLLFLDPEAKMDPFSTPPAVLELVENVRVKIQKKREEITSLSNAVPPETPESPPNIKPIFNAGLATAFVPFGYPQIIKGRTFTGVIIAAAELAFLGLNIGAYWWKHSIPMPQNPSIVTTQEKMNAYQSAQIVQFSALGALAAIYIYGVLDELFL